MKVGEIMNFRKLFLCASFVFIMFLSTINVNASDNVKIKSIDLVDKSVNTTEVSNATFNGLTMNFDLKFMSVDDYAKYKVIVENNESKDYKILVDSNFSNSKYITYDYEKTDNLKANSDNEFYVTVSYKNEVGDSDFSDGKYTEKNSAVLKLDDGSISNPVTSNNEVMIIIGLILMSSILFALFKNNKNKSFNFIILFIVLLLPLFVKAIDSLKITVNSNVVIEKGYSVDYEVVDYIKTSEFDDYDLSNADCSGSVYVGNISEENRYVYCDGAIRKGKKRFYSGSKVNLSDTDMPNYYYFDWDSCKNPDGSSITDYWDGSNDYLCTSVENQKFSVGSYLYKYSYQSEYFGYQISDDDISSMKFTDVIDLWDSERRIYIKDNTSFIMPNHDVLFDYAEEE